MSKLDKPPGPPNRLGLGNFRAMMRDPLGFMAAAAEHGPVVDIQLLFEPYCLVVDPALIQQALTQGNSVMHKDRFTHQLSRVMGQGLVTSEGELWRKQRKLVSHAFTPRRIRTYGDSMVAATRRSLAQWSDGDEVDIHASMAELTLDVVGRTLFDADVRGDAREVGTALQVFSDFYGDVLESPFAPPNWWPTPRMARFRKGIRDVDRILGDIIQDRRQSGEDRGDLLSALLQAQDDDGGGMSDKQLRDECVTLFLAGHETTSLALANTFYLLSQHPEIERRVHAEVVEVLGDRTATSEDVKLLEYTERAIKESMRLYPPVYATGRLLLEDYELGGYTIKKGTNLLFVQWVTHRHPDYFPNPLEYDPDRWRPERAQTIRKYAYFPFGGGPRICIANHFAMMEGVLLLATIIRDYRLELVSGETLELKPSVTLRPAQGLKMKLVARGSNPAKAA